VGVHIYIHIFHNFIFTSRARIKSPGMGCASSKAANPVVATPQIPPNKVQGYEAQTIGLKRGAHETGAALPSDTPATNVSRGSEVLKLQSKAWYKNADGTQAVCTILKVHYDDIPPYYTIVIDGHERSTVRTKLEPLSKADKLQVNRRIFF
jgi:hypothetical protein